MPDVKGSLGSKIILPERDDAAEFDDTSTNAELAGVEDDKVDRMFQSLSMVNR